MPEEINQQSLQQLGSLELIARQVVEGFITGMHKSPFHGFSVEFAEHRLYNPGESVKHIDWKLYGRTEKLFIKRFEEETNLRCQLVIDQSSSMYYPEAANNKMRFSVYAAASLMYLLKKQRDAFGLTCFSDHIHFHTRAKSSTVHQKVIINHMEMLLNNEQKNLTTNVAATLHTIAESIHQRSLVVIFSDMLEHTASLDEIFSAFQHLKYNKHEVILFHVIDKAKEIDFDFVNRPYEFVDLETGEKLRIRPNEIKQTYVEAAKSFRQELMIKCGQYKIDFEEADIARDFKQVLMPFLAKRARMSR
jgi:uncharacterized protein (DUF58 family)